MKEDKISAKIKNVTITSFTQENKVSAKGKEYPKYTLKANNMPFSFTSYNLPNDITNENGELLSFDAFLSVYKNKEFTADLEMEFVPNNFNGQEGKRENIVGIHITPTF